MSNISENLENDAISSVNLKKRTIIGRVLAAILLVVSIATIAVIEYLQMVPVEYVVGAAVILVALFAVVVSLMKFMKEKKGFYVGAALSVILTVALIICCGYAIRGRMAVENIATTDGNITKVNVYVLKDDPAKNIKDAKNYNFGVLASQDEQFTKKTVQKINKDVNKKIKTTKEDNVQASMDALRNHDVNAIVLKAGYMDAFTDTPGYENINNELKVIATYEIKTQDMRKVSGKLKDHFVVYLSGIDTEGSPSVTSRSDVNILAYVNVKTHQVMLLSTPRDFYVKIPGVSKGKRDKLTHAGLYGIDKSIDTLEDIYGTKIDYYFRLNFTGFRQIIDSLGGITVESDYKFTAYDGSKFVKGTNHLDGARALAFARERHAFPRGDEQRGIDQMKVIRAVLDKCMSSDMLTHYDSVLSSLEDSFEMNVPYSVISEMVKMQLSDNPKWDIISAHTTGYNASKVCYSLGSRACVMLPSEESIDYAKDLIEDIENDKKLDQDEIDKKEDKITARAESGILTKDGKKITDLYDTSEDEVTKSKYSTESTTEKKNTYTPKKYNITTEKQDNDDDSTDNNKNKARHRIHDVPDNNDNDKPVNPNRGNGDSKPNHPTEPTGGDKTQDNSGEVKPQPQPQPQPAEPEDPAAPTTNSAAQ